MEKDEWPRNGDEYLFMNASGAFSMMYGGIMFSKTAEKDRHTVIVINLASMSDQTIRQHGKNGAAVLIPSAH